MRHKLGYQEEEEKKYVEFGKMLIGCLFVFSAERCVVKVRYAIGTPTTVKCESVGTINLAWRSKFRARKDVSYQR